MSNSKWDTAETIAYAIEKQCSEWNLTEWVSEWSFTVDDFYRFLDLGKETFRKEQESGE